MLVYVARAPGHDGWIGGVENCWSGELDCHDTSHFQALNVFRRRSQCLIPQRVHRPRLRLALAEGQ